MLKFINLKKLTANSLMGILVVAGFVVGTNNNRVLADSCSNNNGHGNNAPFTHILDNGGKLTINYYDPSNRGKNSATPNIINDLINGVRGCLKS